MWSCLAGAAAGPLCGAAGATTAADPATDLTVTFAGAMAALQDAPPAEKAEEKEWKFHIEAGLAGAAGNSENLNVTAGFVATREVPTSRLLIDTFYYYGESDNVRSVNRYTLGALHDWLFVDSPWLIFAQGRFVYDEFQPWDYRLTGNGGVGYKLIQQDDFTFTLRGGVGFTKDWGSLDDDIHPQALLGFDLTWKISERQGLVAGLFYVPFLDDTPEFRAVSYVGWELLVDPELNLSANARLEYEYQSQVDPGFDRNDVRIVAGLVYDF